MTPGNDEQRHFAPLDDDSATQSGKNVPFWQALLRTSAILRIAATVILNMTPGTDEQRRFAPLDDDSATQSGKNVPFLTDLAPNKRHIENCYCCERLLDFAYLGVYNYPGSLDCCAISGIYGG